MPMFGFKFPGLDAFGFEEESDDDVFTLESRFEYLGIPYDATATKDEDAVGTVLFPTSTTRRTTSNTWSTSTTTSSTPGINTTTLSTGRTLPQPIPQWLLDRGMNLVSVTDGLIDEAECLNLIKFSELLGYERAMLNIGGGRQQVTEGRSHSRVIVDCHFLAAELFSRLLKGTTTTASSIQRQVQDQLPMSKQEGNADDESSSSSSVPAKPSIETKTLSTTSSTGAETPATEMSTTSTSGTTTGTPATLLLPPTLSFNGGETWHLSRLNPRLRFLRYEPGEIFDWHMDGTYTDRNTQERSFITVQLYLNDVGGGETSNKDAGTENADAAVLADYLASKRTTDFYAGAEEVDEEENEDDSEDIDFTDVRPVSDEEMNDAEAAAKAQDEEDDDIVFGEADQNNEPFDHEQKASRLAQQEDNTTGGGTIFAFDGSMSNKGGRDFSCRPRSGRVLLFFQKLLHCGDRLKSGLKYTIRTEVMYHRDPEVAARLREESLAELEELGLSTGMDMTGENVDTQKSPVKTAVHVTYKPKIQKANKTKRPVMGIEVKTKLEKP
ncbi:unnamed protein product [Amoebophrya sp. A25]|nr:unnamed protein product [Amoebophrya sp. A25]|eukprot:GSA25T00004184001.1